MELSEGRGRQSAEVSDCRGGHSDIENVLLDIQGFWDGSPPIAEAGMPVDSPASAAAAIVRTAARRSRLRTWSSSSWAQRGQVDRAGEVGGVSRNYSFGPAGERIW